jgi:hypothetical protein
MEASITLLSSFKLISAHLFQKSRQTEGKKKERLQMRLQQAEIKFYSTYLSS